MRSQNEDLDRPTRAGTMTATQWLLVGGFLVGVVIVIVFVLNWWATPFGMFSPNNMAHLSRQANEQWQSLQAQQASITVVEQKINNFTLSYGTDQSKWPQGKSTEITQLRAELANKTTAYNAACGQYRAMWADEWRGIPAPDDLPTTCSMR